MFLYTDEEMDFTEINFGEDASNLFEDPTYERMEELIRNGANVNDQDENGDTPAHLWHLMARVPKMNLLIKNGADLNIKNKAGQNVLHTQVIYTNFNKNINTDLLFDSEKLVTLILKNKVDVNAKDNAQLTPMFYCKNTSILKLLLDYGANVFMRDADGNTILSYQKEKESIELLLAHGLSINSKNTDGQIPLHKIILEDYDLVKYCLMMGADINSQDVNGNTPLHMYMYNYGKYCVYDMLVLFKRMGANFRINNKDLINPYDMIKYYNKEMYKRIKNYK